MSDVIPFVLLLPLADARIEPRTRAACARRFRESIDSPVGEIDLGGPSALVAQSAGAARRESPVARLRDVFGVGDIRLDNRDEIAAMARVKGAECSDLELVLAALDRLGQSCIPRLLGDFAFVACRPATREVVAARDAFGVRLLYYASSSRLLAFASRASALAEGEAYDPEFLAEFLLAAAPPSDRSIFSGVRQLPAASIARLRDDHLETRRYWRAADFPPQESRCSSGEIDEFRELFRRAVRLRVEADAPVWSQLSGGLDSSSVVCTAAALAGAGVVRDGVAGTITLVDSAGSGDEREFVAAVVGQCGVRNVQVTDYALWQDDALPPPRTDQPELAYPLWARDRRMRDVVQEHGGRVLLSGVGSDHYLTGNLHFFADWMARGRIAHACREMARWCTRGRTSFWKFAFENAVVPLLPAAPRRMLRRGGERIPRWIAPSFARRYDLEHRLQWRRLVALRGDQYAGTVRFEVDHMWSCLDRGVVDDALEMRYPFLYRPLVEFSLALPPAMRTRPFARKWILREAMNGVLPELVRTRRGKGGISGRVELSLVRERARIDAMLRDPVLGQLGAVVPSRVRAAVAAACAGDEWARSQVTTTLALETWLAVRAGRWPEATHRSTPIEHGPLSPVPTR